MNKIIFQRKYYDGKEVISIKREKKYSLDESNKKRKVCSHPECEKLALYGFPIQLTSLNESEKSIPLEGPDQRPIPRRGPDQRPILSPFSKREKCFTHKLDGMINLSRGVCSYPECDKTPYYAFHDQKDGERRCFTHKLKGMINISTKKCRFLLNGERVCFRSAIFGIPGGSSEFCSLHKKEGTINLKTQRCQTKGCGFFAFYGNASDGVRVACVNHKTSEMIEMSHGASKLRGRISIKK